MTNDSIKVAVQSVVQDLFDRNGSVKSTELVDEARPKNSPAHPAFEWDDTLAGEEYRLIQARKWIRVVEIIREADSEPERLVHVPRIVTSDDARRDGEYKPISVVVERPDEFARALSQAREKFASAKRAMDDLYRAAERSGMADQAAVIAQMSRATDLWAAALEGLH